MTAFIVRLDSMPSCVIQPPVPAVFPSIDRVSLAAGDDLPRLDGMRMNRVRWRIGRALSCLCEMRADRLAKEAGKQRQDVFRLRARLRFRAWPRNAHNINKYYPCSAQGESFLIFFAELDSRACFSWRDKVHRDQIGEDQGGSGKGLFFSCTFISFPRAVILEISTAGVAESVGVPGMVRCDNRPWFRRDGPRGARNR